MEVTAGSGRLTHRRLAAQSIFKLNFCRLRQTPRLSRASGGVSSAALNRSGVMQDYIHSERLYIHSANGKSLNLSLLSFSERTDGRESRASLKDKHETQQACDRYQTPTLHRNDCTIPPEIIESNTVLFFHISKHLTGVQTKFSRRDKSRPGGRRQ